MSKRATYRVNADGWWKLQDILCNPADEFNPDSATLRGRSVERVGYFETGKLPRTDRSEMIDSVVKYVIYSYDTPIAYWRIADWNGDGSPNYEWIMPEVRYSVPTSKHQGKVRTALSQISGGI